MQTPIEGTSLVYAFNDAKAPERHTTQYFEMFGNRAIYNDGWLARTIHRAPWQTSGLQPLTSDVWDLYDVRNDFSLTKNLAGEQAAKLKEMQALFMTEAEKYHVLPIDDRTIERMNPALAGRPDVLGDRKSLTLYEGMQGMLENTFMNIKNRSSKITAELEIPARASGAILSQGGRFGGWSLYMKDGRPAYTYNFLGLSRYTVTAPQALPPDPVTVTLDFAYDGGGAGKGGKATLYVNGKQVAEGRVEKTQPNIFSADETADVGMDNQTPVAEGIGIGPETRFTGKINKITLGRCSERKREDRRGRREQAGIDVAVRGDRQRDRRGDHRHLAVSAWRDTEHQGARMAVSRCLAAVFIRLDKSDTTLRSGHHPARSAAVQEAAAHAASS